MIPPAVRIKIKPIQLILLYNIISIKTSKKRSEGIAAPWGYQKYC